MVEAPGRIATQATVSQCERERPCAPCGAGRALRRAVRVVGLHGCIATHRLPYRGRVLCAHLAVSWPRSQYSPAFSPPSCHNTPWCIAIQSLLPAFLSHNTSSVLRYNVCLAYPLPVTIQFGLYRDMLIPQPAYLSITIQPVYCDTLFPIHQALAVTIQKFYRDTAYQSTNLQYSSPMLQYNPNLLQYTFPA